MCLSGWKRLHRFLYLWLFSYFPLSGNFRTSWKYDWFFFRVFHDLSIQLLNKCDSTDENSTYRLIARHMKGWNGESCFRMINLLDLEITPKNSQLITHPSFQHALSAFWKGDFDSQKYQRSSYSSLALRVSTCFSFWYIFQRMWTWYFLQK